MLEDMYGENKKEWPSPRYKKDLNNDGFSDWVAIKKRLFTERKVRSRNFLVVFLTKRDCVQNIVTLKLNH